jgi:glycosyltransferase involved in cell wall biosynthesis
LFLLKQRVNNSARLVAKPIMRILFVADGRSPIALNWIAHFTESSLSGGYEVHLASTYACQPQLDLASLSFVAVAFSGAASGYSGPSSKGDVKISWRSALRQAGTAGLRTALRQWLGPVTLPKAARKLEEIVREVKPDMVHAMRIPFEGMLSAQALRNSSLPLLVSVWGNDFTLHAPATPWMGGHTRRALRRANALHADCQRDLRLAQTWGFAGDKPAVVLPGNGGIRMDVFYPPDQANQIEPNKGGSFQVINPRGFRAYMRNDVFFHAIPQVLESEDGVHFICPAMQQEAQAQRWVQELGLQDSVELLPKQSRLQMAELFRGSQIAVSPSTHDGTPNTLLEAMSSGCFPIAGDIESLREWITNGVNGLLVDPGDAGALAKAILQALRDPEMRRRASQSNRELIRQRAEYHHVMRQAEKFYRQIAGT